MHAKSLSLCPIFWDPIESSPPHSSVHGILQARILEWVAMPFSRESSQLRDQTCIFYVSCIGKWFHYHWIKAFRNTLAHKIVCLPVSNSWYWWWTVENGGIPLWREEGCGEEPTCTVSKASRCVIAKQWSGSKLLCISSEILLLEAFAELKLLLTLAKLTKEHFREGKLIYSDCLSSIILTSLIFLP